MVISSHYISEILSRISILNFLPNDCQLLLTDSQSQYATFRQVLTIYFPLYTYIIWVFWVILYPSSLGYFYLHRYISKFCIATYRNETASPKKAGKISKKLKSPATNCKKPAAKKLSPSKVWIKKEGMERLKQICITFSHSQRVLRSQSQSP